MERVKHMKHYYNIGLNNYNLQMGAAQSRASNPARRHNKGARFERPRGSDYRRLPVDDYKRPRESEDQRPPDDNDRCQFDQHVYAQLLCRQIPKA